MTKRKKRYIFINWESFCLFCHLDNKNWWQLILLTRVNPLRDAFFVMHPFKIVENALEQTGFY